MNIGRLSGPLLDRFDLRVLLDRHGVETGFLPELREGWLELRQICETSARSQVLVARERGFAAAVRDRDDRAVEPPRLLRMRGAALALDCVGVHRFAAVPVEGRDEVRADALRHEILVPGDLRIDRPGAAIRTHRDARHRFDTAADRDVGLARHHLRGSGVDGLEPRGAEAVQLLARDRLIELGDERRYARDVRALLPDRGYAAEHDVVDDAGVESIAITDRAQRLRRELDRRNTVQRAVGTAATAGRSHMVEDECVGHVGSPARPANLTDISPGASP